MKVRVVFEVADEKWVDPGSPSGLTDEGMGELLDTLALADKAKGVHVEAVHEVVELEGKVKGGTFFPRAGA